MDERGTFIKEYRKTLHNELFQEKPFDKWHAFHYLKLRAQDKPTDVIIKGRIIHLERGQLIEGTEKLAEIWGWSRNKVNRFFKLLSDTEMCSTYGTPCGTVITIENYAYYQDRRTPSGTTGGTSDGTTGGTSDGTTGGTSDGTYNKKDKKDKKDNKDKNPPISPRGGRRGRRPRNEVLEMLKEELANDQN